jgi:hypothetical protein
MSRRISRYEEQRDGNGHEFCITEARAGGLILEEKLEKLKPDWARRSRKRLFQPYWNTSRTSSKAGALHFDIVIAEEGAL